VSILVRSIVLRHEILKSNVGQLGDELKKEDRETTRFIIEIVVRLARDRRNRRYDVTTVEGFVRFDVIIFNRIDRMI
jgi:hypothetical protein